MSLKATARSVPGSLRQEVVVAGRHHLVTDQPESAGGEDCGPSPHELLPAALAACIAYTLVRYARTKSWDLGEVRVDVDYDHRAEPRELAIDTFFTADLDDEQLARLRKVAAACPLRRSLELGFTFHERLGTAQAR
jgi:putative redox protein